MSDRVTSLGVLVTFPTFAFSAFFEFIWANLCTLRPEPLVFCLSIFCLVEMGVGGLDVDVGLVIFGCSNYRLLGLCL